MRVTLSALFVFVAGCNAGGGLHRVSIEHTEHADSIDGHGGSPPPSTSPTSDACDAVALVCADANFETAPATAMTAGTSSDAACDFDALIATGVAACGARVDVAVDEGGSIDDAMAQCGGGFCVVAMPAGNFAAPSSLSCAALVGAGIGQTNIAGSFTMTNGIVAGASVSGSDYAIDVDGAFDFFSNAEVAGAYASIGKNRSSADLRVCSSLLRAGYVGIDVAWESTGALVSGTSIAACYTGIDVNWGSSEVNVDDSHLVGGVAGLEADWGSFDVAITNSVLQGSAALAVDDQPDMIAGGTTPTHNVTNTGTCLLNQ